MTLHSLPFEASLLARVRLTPSATVVPAERGVAVPLAVATPSPAAAFLREAAIAANPRTGKLRGAPRRIVDQQKLECCVSCALAGAMEAMGSAPPTLSPVFHYHVTRFINGGADSKGRLFLDKGIETLTRQGICRDQDHPQPFTEAGAAVRPTAEAFRDASTRLIPFEGLAFRYEPVSTVSRAVDIRRHIDANHPVIVAFTMPQGYPEAFLTTGHRWLNERAASSPSKHCVLIVAYDDGLGAVRIVDSQGPLAFDRGMWWMGYRVVDSGFVHQAFALT